jgi:hypothetical protein
LLLLLGLVAAPDTGHGHLDPQQAAREDEGGRVAVRQRRRQRRLVVRGHRRRRCQVRADLHLLAPDTTAAKL